MWILKYFSIKKKKKQWDLQEDCKKVTLHSQRAQQHVLAPRNEAEEADRNCPGSGWFPVSAPAHSGATPSAALTPVAPARPALE